MFAAFGAFYAVLTFGLALRSSVVASYSSRSDRAGSAEREGMSFTSLRSLTGAASLATAAFDTAKSNLKAMAEAAASAAPAPDAAAETAVATDAVSAEPRKGMRQGVQLDAYA